MRVRSAGAVNIIIYGAGEVFRIKEVGAGAVKKIVVQCGFSLNLIFRCGRGFLQVRVRFGYAVQDALMNKKSGSVILLS